MHAHVSWMEDEDHDSRWHDRQCSRKYMSKFPEIPCENAYEQLVASDPDLLVEWAESGELIKPSDLTFAAEHLGKCQKSLPVLLQLLKHDSPVVREGAIYGLFGLRELISDALDECAEKDPNATIRDIAHRRNW